MAAGPAVVALLLAGGASSRFGGHDKGLWPLPDGQPLAARTLARLRASLPAGAHLAVNANQRAADWARALPGVEPWPDPRGPGGGGPLAGVAEGLARAAQRGARWLLTVPVDAGGLPTDYAARLLAGGDATPERAAVAAVAVMPRPGVAPGNAAPDPRAAWLVQHPCALWPVTPGWQARVARALAAGRGPRAALAIDPPAREDAPTPQAVDEGVDLPTRRVVFPRTPELAFSLNTPDEVDEWWRRATEGR